MTVGQYVLTIALLVFAGILIFYIKTIKQHEDYEFYKNLRNPDGILCLNETQDGPLKANFILCISFDELMQRDRVILEVRRLPMDSQENQDT